MASKRKCGFLTTPVAKRLKLPKALLQYINRFLLPPRKQYAYFHQDLAACYYGTRIQRPLAMRFILAAIVFTKKFGQPFDEYWSEEICIIDGQCKTWMKAKQYGAVLPTCQKVMANKAQVLLQLYMRIKCLDLMF
jgi:hypothetical protein